MTIVYPSALISIPLFFLSIYCILFTIRSGTYRTDWSALYDLNVFMARKFNEFKLLVNVVFCHPPGKDLSGRREGMGEGEDNRQRWTNGHCIDIDKGTEEQKAEREYDVWWISSGSQWLGRQEKAQPLKLFFSDQSKVSTSAGAENSVIQIIG